MTRHEQFPIALILAVSLLLTGLPLVASGGDADRRPALTLDICSPAQPAGATYTQCTLPIRTPHAWPQRIPSLCGVADAAPATDRSRLADSPDSPPPKNRSVLAA